MIAKHVAAQGNEAKVTVCGVPDKPGIAYAILGPIADAGIEVDYVRNLIRKRNLIPETAPLACENWPWPVKICTLGGFKLVIEDKPIEFTGKVQKKPIEMLKALIAFGGDEVSEDRIIDALWPDADGDTARISFKTTLHRLRQLFGKDELIQLQDGRVSLDRRLFWVDAWAFERMLEESPRHPVTRSLDRYFLEKALHLYRGHFLSGDGDKPWATSMQERLRSKYLRAVSRLGNYWLDQFALKINDRSQSKIRNPKSAINNAID